MADQYELTGAKVFDDLDEALRHDGVDIVTICTPQHKHCQNVLAAADAGKHIIIEKPVAISLAELRLMRDAVDHAAVKTIVGFVLRWNPLFQNIKRLIADETLGEVACVETDYQSYNSDWWGGWEDGRRADTGVSAMTVAGCHAIDALRWFVAPGEFEAADPIEVFAYAGGRRKGITCQFNPTSNDWHEGTIKNNRLFCPGRSDANGWVDIPGICPDSSDVSHHPFQGLVDHFVQCLQGDVESHCNLADAVKTHEVVFAMQQCYASGQPVQIPLI